MANRNLADEVDALAKGLASLRVAIRGLSARVAKLEAPVTFVQSAQSLARMAAKVVRGRELPKSSRWQRIRAWWAR